MSPPKTLDRLYVSAVTLAEIRCGIEILTDPAQRIALNKWLSHKVHPMFGARVLGVTEDTMLQWRIMVDVGRQTGHTFPQPDLIIAATAFHHGLTVLMRDVVDYARAGVPVFNPWNESPPAQGAG